MEQDLDISRYVVRDPNGIVDAQSSHVKFAQDLSALIANERSDDEIIGQAVNKVWAERKVKTLPMPALVHYAMAYLDVPHDHFGETQERVADYIRAKKHLFRIGKGKGGGVTRLNLEEVEAQTTNTASSIPPQPQVTSSIPPSHPSSASIRIRTNA